MQPMLNIAIRAARQAGDIILRHLNRLHQLEVIDKGRHDFVTQVDRNAEATIIQTLHQAYPGHGFLAEESGRQGSEEFLWIIDPLDGTTNYLHGYPQFAVSIALAIRGRLEHAVIYDPFKQDLFTASRGEGAQLNNRRIRVSRQGGLDGALIGTGFPVRAVEHLEAYMDQFRAVFPHSSGIRRAGSAALDLAWVACGRLDGFWESQLKAWDIAAGVLLIQEAGGLVSDLDGGDDYLAQGAILAGNPRVHRELLACLQGNGRT